MKVGVVGAGAIGHGYAALLASRGHTPLLWSPRGSRVSPDRASLAVHTVGLLKTEVEVPVVHDPAGLADAETLVICVLGNGHRAVMDRLAPHLGGGQTVIVSSHASLGALYLSRLLAERRCGATILAWATTVTGGPIRDGVVQVKLLRSEMDIAALPASRIEHGLALSRTLFGDRFVAAPDLLSITLSNLNPPIHMANAMLNYTRMEFGEVWANYGCITPGVGRLIDALDEERLAVATAFGLKVRSVVDHYHKTFSGLPSGLGVSAMAQIVEGQRKGSSPGPASVHHRFLTEDLPFGIHALIEIAKVAGIAVPMHEAGLAVLSTVYGRDFRADNDLLPQLDLASMDARTLHARCKLGWAGAG